MYRFNTHVILRTCYEHFWVSEWEKLRMAQGFLALQCSFLYKKKSVICKSKRISSYTISFIISRCNTGKKNIVIVIVIIIVIVIVIIIVSISQQSWPNNIKIMLHQYYMTFFHFRLTMVQLLWYSIPSLFVYDHLKFN